MEQALQEMKERFDAALEQTAQCHLQTPQRWQHPRFPAGTKVLVEECIKLVHSKHPLAGKTSRACHGDEQEYPAVPVEIPGETSLYEDYTTGRCSLVPEEYVEIVKELLEAPRSRRHVRWQNMR